MKLTRNVTLTLRITALSLAAGVCLVGDTLTLRNGNLVEGTYLGGSAREVRMDTGDRVQSFPIDTVTGIQFSAGSVSSSSSSSSASAPINSQRSDDSYNRPRLSRSDASSGSSSASSSSSYPPPPPSNDSAYSGGELPAGTQLTVRMIDTVDSDVAHLGDNFRASIDEPVLVNGQTLISRGADVTARLVDDQRSGKIQGKTVLKLILTSMNVNGHIVEISTQDVIQESSSRGSRSAKVIGGTAALGAIIGGIAGGGKGAAIGAGSGAAVGTGAQELGRGQRVRIPSETRLVFTLANSVRL